MKLPFIHFILGLKIQLTSPEDAEIYQCLQYKPKQDVSKDSNYSVFLDLNSRKNEEKSIFLDYEISKDKDIESGRLSFKIPTISKCMFKSNDEGIIFAENFRCYFFNPKKSEKYCENYENNVVDLNSSPLKKEIFSFVDLSDPDVLELNIQPLPEKFNVSGYNVEVWRRRGETARQMDFRYFFGSHAVNDNIIFPYHTFGSKGTYHFSITPDTPECKLHGCFKSSSAHIVVGTGNNSLVIGIVCASTMIPILLYSFYLWNRKCRRRDFFEDVL